MPTTNKPKAKKTKGGSKAKSEPTKRATKKAAKNKKRKIGKKVMKAAVIPGDAKEKKFSPEEEGIFDSRPELDVDAAKEASRREELDRLIAQESIGDQRIFANKGGEKQIFEDSSPGKPAKLSPQKVYMTNGDSVSIYRRILLWTSVGLCAVVIIFGWVLTIGGSLGLKQADAEYDEPSRINELTEEIKNELEEVRDELRKANEEAKVNVGDDTLETIVEEISNATSTDENVGEEGRDIFSPPTSTEGIIEE